MVYSSNLIIALSLVSSTLAGNWFNNQLWATTYAGAFSTFNFNTDTRALTNVSTSLDAGYQPGWVTNHPWLPVLYTVERGKSEGGVYAWKYDREGKVTKLSSAGTKGASAVHCDISPDGKTLAVPNIAGGNMAVFAVSWDGTFGSEPSATFNFPFTTVGPNVKEQSASRPHQAAFDGNSRNMYVPNLGTDRVHVFQVLGAGRLKQLDDIILPDGSGPRHLTFWPPMGPSSFMYLVNQLSNTVMVFDISTKARGASPKLIQTISTLGAGLPPTAPNVNASASEVVVTPDTRFLIAANRNAPSESGQDTLASFSINPYGRGSHLKFLSLTGTGGKNPRHHAIDPTGRYIAIANQDSGINIVERNAWNGEFKGVVANYTTKSPVSVLWRPF